jgi:hypothetical protein
MIGETHMSPNPKPHQRLIFRRSGFRKSPGLDGWRITSTLTVYENEEKEYSKVFEISIVTLISEKVLKHASFATRDKLFDAFASVHDDIFDELEREISRMYYVYGKVNRETVLSVIPSFEPMIEVIMK